MERGAEKGKIIEKRGGGTKNYVMGKKKEKERRVGERGGESGKIGMEDNK